MKLNPYIMLVLLFCVGCLPKPIQPQFSLLVGNVNEDVSVIKSMLPNASNSKSQFKKHGNLIVLIADSYIQSTFKKQIEQVYSDVPGVRLEDLVWWEYFSSFGRMYDKIIYLSFKAAKYKNLMDSIMYMESLKQPYDVVLLSHGFPNHLTTGEAGYFLSFKELNQIKGQLNYLHLVFMQSCYGSSLSQDWLDAGAKHVIGFRGLNRNFFYFSVFLRYYLFKSDEEAFKLTNEHLKHYLNSAKYRLLLSQLSLTVDQYLEATEAPELY